MNNKFFKRKKTFFVDKNIPIILNVYFRYSNFNREQIARYLLYIFTAKSRNLPRAA